MGVSQNQGYLFGGPFSKDCSILGSMLGSPYLGKLPHIVIMEKKMETTGITGVI